MIMAKNSKTSWGNEAEWYSDHLAEDDTYHAKVVLPNVLRLVDPKKGQKVLEIGGGEGFIGRELAKKGATVLVTDISPELIEIGKKKGGGPAYKVSNAENLSWTEAGAYDVVLAVLTIQNMEKIDAVMKGVARALKPDGRFLFVLNHPVVRVPKSTHWGYDEKEKVQYRRLDSYLSAKKTEIDMHPGKKGKKSVTYSFHRSLQEYMKVLRSAGFCITRLEEWISHRTSEPGPRAKAENAARKEFPLFMAIEARPFTRN